MGIILVAIYVGSTSIGCLAVMYIIWKYEVRIELREKPCSKCGRQTEENTIAEYGLWPTN